MWVSVSFSASLLGILPPLKIMTMARSRQSLVSEVFGVVLDDGSDVGVRGRCSAVAANRLA